MKKFTEFTEEQWLIEYEKSFSCGVGLCAVCPFRAKRWGGNDMCKDTHKKILAKNSSYGMDRVGRTIYEMLKKERENIQKNIALIEKL